MSEFLRELVDPQALFPAVVLLVLTLAFIHIMNSNNPLQWWHYVATKGGDGHYIADVDKLWQNVGAAIASVAIILLAYRGTLEWAIFAAYLAFVGGVRGYGAYLKSKEGSITSTRTTEPAPGPQKVTESKIQTPPIGGDHDNG